MRITHDDLEDLGRELGFSLGYSNGICLGYTFSLTLAILAEDELTFYERLKFIGEYKKPNGVFEIDRLVGDINQVYDKIKKHEKEKPLVLEPREQVLIEIPAFYSRVALHQATYNFSDFFDVNYAHPWGFERIYGLTKPDTLKSDLHKVFNQIVAKAKAEELEVYFDELASILSTQTTPLPIVIHCFDHAVSLRFDRETNAWVFSDINEWDYIYTNKGKDINYNEYYRLFDTAEKLTRFFINEFMKEGPIVFSLTIFAIEPLAISKESLEDFSVKHTLTKEQWNFVAKNTATPLLLAIADRNIKAITQALSFKVDFNNPSHGETPLHAACRYGYLDVVQELLKLEDDIELNKADNMEMTPLYIACEKGHTGVVRELLKQIRKIDVNKSSFEGVSPLYIACENGHTDVVRELLKQDGIDFNKAKKSGSTPLYIACQNGHTEIVEELLKHQEQGHIDINQPCFQGLTALYIACKNGHTKTVELLLQQKGIEFDKPMPNGQTPLQVANEKKYYDIAELIKFKTSIVARVASLGTASDSEAEAELDNIFPPSPKRIRNDIS